MLTDLPHKALQAAEPEKSCLGAVSKRADPWVDAASKHADRCVEAILRQLGRVDTRLEQLQDTINNILAEEELRQLVGADGEAQAASGGVLQRFVEHFSRSDDQDVAPSCTPEQAIEVFRRLSSPPPKKVVVKLPNDQVGLTLLLGRWFLIGFVIAVLVLLIHLGLTAGVFTNGRGFVADKSSGALLATDAPVGPVAAASTVSLRPLWSLPDLPLEELRKVEEVLFNLDQATHVIRAAGLSRTPDGAVLIRAVGGASVRVRPGGQALWKPSATSAEVLLTAMDAWRTLPGGTQTGWLSSSVLESQVLTAL